MCNSDLATLHNLSLTEENSEASSIFHQHFINFQPSEQKLENRKSTSSKLLLWLHMPYPFIKAGSTEILPERHERMIVKYCQNQTRFLVVVSHWRNLICMTFSYKSMILAWFYSKIGSFIKFRDSYLISKISLFRWIMIIF